MNSFHLLARGGRSFARRQSLWRSLQAYSASLWRLVRWRQTWRFRLLFAVVGALCWGITADGLEAWIVPGMRLQVGARRDVPALLFESLLTLQPPRDETERRLQREGALRGEYEIALQWNTRTDLDLSVIEPSGERIAFDHRSSGNGGQLDVDENVTPHTVEPVEHIVWPFGSAMPGRYQVLVHHYGWHEGPNPTPFQVQVLRHRAAIDEAAIDEPQDGSQPDQTHILPIERHLFTGQALYRQQPQRVATFIVPRRPTIPWTVRLGKACRVAAPLLFSLRGVQLIMLTALWSLAGTAVLAFGFVLVQQKLLQAEHSEPALDSTRRTLRYGAWAGAGGQLFCSVATAILAALTRSDGMPIPRESRWLGLTLLSLLVAGTLSRNVPWLPRPLALAAATIGAALGTIVLTSNGDHPDRVFAAVILGAAIGFAITPPTGGRNHNHSAYNANTYSRAGTHTRIAADTLPLSNSTNGYVLVGDEAGGYRLVGDEIESLTVAGSSLPTQNLPTQKRGRATANH